MTKISNHLNSKGKELSPALSRPTRCDVGTEKGRNLQYNVLFMEPDQQNIGDKQCSQDAADPALNSRNRNMLCPPTLLLDCVKYLLGFQLVQSSQEEKSLGSRAPTPCVSRDPGREKDTSQCSPKLIRWREIEERKHCDKSMESKQS